MYSVSRSEGWFLTSPDMRDWRYTGRIVIAVVSGWAKRKKIFRVQVLHDVCVETNNKLRGFDSSQSVILFFLGFFLLQNQTLPFSTPLRTLQDEKRKTLRTSGTRFPLTRSYNTGFNRWWFLEFLDFGRLRWLSSLENDGIHQKHEVFKNIIALEHLRKAFSNDLAEFPSRWV